MATYTGYLRNVGLDALTGKQPKLELILSEPSFKGANFIVTDPYPVTIATDGACTVEVAATDEMTGDPYYTLRATWLNGEGVPIGFDVPNIKFRTSEPGGTFEDLMGPFASPRQIWFGPQAPSNPSAFTGWVDTSEPRNALGYPYYEWE